MSKYHTKRKLQKMRAGEGRWMSFIERLKLENEPKLTRSAGKLQL